MGGVYSAYISQQEGCLGLRHLDQVFLTLTEVAVISFPISWGKGN